MKTFIRSQMLFAYEFDVLNRRNYKIDVSIIYYDIFLEIQR